MKIFQDLKPSLRLGNWAPSSLRKHLFKEETLSIEKLCQLMMNSDGEFSSLLLAERILNAFDKLNESEILSFFNLLEADFDLDLGELKAAIAHYESDPNSRTLSSVTRTAEPKRQELLRRLNLAPNATSRLVKMRERLLSLTQFYPELGKIDTDFRHLFNSWFNRGFLILRPIDWTTPAHILEKIIAYEAVHEIENWTELRRRLEPSDRYCYAFFHPSMDDEPLVFVEVALTESVPERIDQVLMRESSEIDPDKANCAVFYSISNCHTGLAGVSFGNFLIKQVAVSLKQRFPDLKTFATISPVPGFRNWLTHQASDNTDTKELINRLDNNSTIEICDQLLQSAASYFLTAKNTRNEPLDPVARFHLKNGAILDRINLNADTSKKGIDQSYAVMVNYVYDLKKVEENHENYVSNHVIAAGNQVKKHLPK